MKEMPSLNEVLKSIESFKNEKLKKLDDFENIEEYIKYFDEVFFLHFKNFHRMVQMQNSRMFPFKLFRVRELALIKNRDLFCEYSYPPPVFVKDGRCNFRNYPVFYCSNDPITALLEVVRNTDYKSKRFCISTWSLIDNDEDFILDTFLQSELHPQNGFKNLAKLYTEKIDETFEGKLTQDQIKGVEEYYKFLDSIFIEDRHYSISSYLAHKKLYAGHNYASDMIIYPSVQSDSKSVNFAIHPNFVDNCMKIERFYIVELSNMNRDTGQFELMFSQYGKIENNVILWRKLSPDDKYYEDSLKQDFKAYIDGFKDLNFTKNELI